MDQSEIFHRFKIWAKNHNSGSAYGTLSSTEDCVNVNYYSSTVSNSSYAFGASEKSSYACNGVVFYWGSGNPSSPSNINRPYSYSCKFAIRY